MKNFEQAKYIKSGETVLDRGTQFIIKEARVSTNDGKIVFIDKEGVGHGVYHPDEYLGVGEELARNYFSTLRLKMCLSDPTHIATVPPFQRIDKP